MLEPCTRMKGSLSLIDRRRYGIDQKHSGMTLGIVLGIRYRRCRGLIPRFRYAGVNCQNYLFPTEHFDGDDEADRYPDAQPNQFVSESSYCSTFDRDRSHAVGEVGERQVL